MQLAIFSDYLQIHLLDDGVGVGPTDEWADDGPLSAHLAMTPGGVGFFTGINGPIVVVMEVLDGPPADDRHAFTEVVESSILVSSGRLVLTAPVYGEGDGDRIDVPAGWLRLRTAHARSPFDGPLDDEDADPPRIRIQCWPAPPAAAVLVKGWDPAAGREVG